jgi:hypothetical protein
MVIDDHGRQIYKGAQTPRQLYFVSKHQVPEVEANTITYFESCLLKYNTQSYIAQDVLWVDEGFENVFKLKMEQGRAAFERPLTALISAEKAKNIFGDQNPVGKVLKVNEGMPVEITGVFASLPSNTHLQADYFFSMKTFVHYGWIPAGGDWQGNNWWNYVRLRPDADAQTVEQKLNSIAVKEMQFLKEKGQRAAFNLQSLQDLHFISGLTGELGAGTSKTSLYNLLLIAALTLFIAWKRHYPSDPFHYVFVDDFFNRQYTAELRFGKFYMILAVLSISIACLGLYGLLLFYLGQKRKEIAIRRISGAQIRQLILFISKDFVKWNMMAFVIACPLVYIMLYNWLQNFAFRTAISWWVFMVAGAVTCMVTLLTVIWQGYKAALQKPTEAIKQE